MPSAIRHLALGLCVVLRLTGSAVAENTAPVTPVPGAGNPPAAASKTETPRDAAAHESMCLMIESAASAHGLPLEFFARVIWQESRFQPDAIGPVTRNGQRAQGVAQSPAGSGGGGAAADGVGVGRHVPTVGFHPVGAHRSTG